MNKRQISRMVGPALLVTAFNCAPVQATSDQGISDRGEVTDAKGELAVSKASDDATGTVPVPPPRDEIHLETYSARRALVYPLLVREAVKVGLPVEIADAVTRIESGYDPKVIGAVGEVGLMQVRPGTAAMLGFGGSNADLAVPETNIRFGVAYLSKAWSLANGDLCRALMKYRAGHGEEHMTALSMAYCARAKAYLSSINSPLGKMTPDEMAQVSTASASAAQRVNLPPLPRARIRTAAVSRAFWSAQEARIRILTARVHAKWQRMAAR